MKHDSLFPLRFYYILRIRRCMIQSYEFLGDVASRSVVDDIEKVAQAGEALNMGGGFGYVGEMI